MKIKSLSFDATIRLEDFCKKAGIKYTADLTNDSSDIRMYDFWIDDRGVSMTIPVDYIYVFTHEYDCRLTRNEFQEIVIL